jgi:hypothetical protein
MSRKKYDPNAGRVVTDGRGMGGFLCPPEHPCHVARVETELRRMPENRGGMSLEFAATCEWVGGAARGAAKRLLREWSEKRPPLSREDVRDWTREVLGYFRGCYKACGDVACTDDKCWHAPALVIASDRDPMQFVELHAGVRAIRRYYPEFAPTAEDFAAAYWGAKPEAARS